MNAARIRALAIIGVLLIAAVVLVKVAMSDDTQTHANYADTCPANTVKVVTKPLPDYPDITLKIYNGSAVPGAAQSLADSLRQRLFKVEPVGKHDDKPTTNNVADITYGPNTVGAAWVVRAEFLLTGPNDYKVMHFNIKNTSKIVTIVIGKGYRQLGANTEVNQAVAALGTPQAPPGTCAANG
jgi:hypothetical protein